MSFSDLQPETWAHILSFLKRETPPPKTAKGWEDLHQQDLLTAMKTSWAMFDLGAPLLYDRPVVADVRSFFLGVGGDHQATIDGLKTRLLENVTRLQLEYRSLDREPSYRSLLGTGRWEETGTRWQHTDDSSVTLSTRARTIDCLQNVAETVSRLPPTIQLGDMLPNLRTVNVAAHARFTWQATEIKIQPPGFIKPSSSQPLSDLYGLLSQTKFFPSLLGCYTNIVHWCQHDQYGPLAFPEPCLVSLGESPLQTFTTHINYELWSAPAVITGVTNRWSLANHLSHCTEDYWAYQVTQSLAAKLNSLFRQGMRRYPDAEEDPDSLVKTRIEIYGLFRGTYSMKAAGRTVLDHNVTQGAARTGTKRASHGDDLGNLAKLQAFLDSRLFEVWRGKVFVKYMIGVEPCPACGLEEVDRYCGGGETDQNQHGGHWREA